jgi:hypothetical protein
MTGRILFALLLASSASAEASSPVAGFVGEYCSRCHDGRVERSGTQVKELDAAHIADDRELWSRTERHLLAGTMPPVGARRPDRGTTLQAIAAIERALDTPAPAVDTSQNIAARLASLLWNAEPDTALLQAAERDQLRDSATLEREVRRMLADPRAEAFVARFFFPWLQLEKLDTSDPDKRFFPDYDPSLRDSLRRETELFLLSQLRDDRDPIELWAAKHSFLNEQLAKHYGVSGVAGTQFRKVSLPMPERAGLLGQGSIMMVTSRHQHGVDAAYTSPAFRARWVLTRYLGVPPPAAEPGAPPVKPEIPITGQTRLFPAKPCVNCHRNFFPLGYALENFDSLGRWRTEDQAGPVDASGAFVDGTPLDGPAQLHKGLMQWSDAFRTSITERLLLHVAGGQFVNDRGTPQSLAAARRILRDSKAIRWSTLIAAAVRSPPLPLD